MASIGSTVPHLVDIRRMLCGVSYHHALYASVGDLGGRVTLQSDRPGLSPGPQMVDKLWVVAIVVLVSRFLHTVNLNDGKAI